jgi:protein gp37
MGAGKYWSASWNPIIGCEKCSPGCRACWALSMVKRAAAQDTEYGRICREALGRGQRDWSDGAVLYGKALNKPSRWRKPRTIAVSWLGDMWRREVPFEWIEAVITEATCAPQHQYLFLTKRSADMEARLWTHLNRRGPDNWLFGASVCNQAEADEKIPHLLRVPGRRWLSVEPLLSEVDIEPFLYESKGRLIDTPDGQRSRVWKQMIHWVVVGAETGPGARPCDPAWVQNIVDQCQSAGVPVWVKQAPGGPWPRERPEGMPKKFSK